MATTKDAPNLQLDWVEIVSPRVWMTTSYNSDYVGNARPAAMLDVAAPLSGWYDMGSVKSVTVPVTKEVFEHKQGAPKTARKIFEIDRSAQIVFNTVDVAPWVEAFMLGKTVYNTLDGTVGKRVASINAGDNARTHFGLASYCASTGWADYDLVVCASPTSASTEDSFNYAVVESTTTNKITLEGFGLPVTPVVGDRLDKVDAVDFIDQMGTDTVRSLILFWDTRTPDGVKELQHVLYYPKVRNFSGGDIDFKDQSEAYEMSVTMSAQAVNMTFADSTTGYDLYKKFILAY
jgi:hypothetical protein